MPCGVVVLDGGVTLDEGTPVEIHPIISPLEPSPTVWEKLAELSGRITDLPPDAARNLDHYLYGIPKNEK